MATTIMKPGTEQLIRAWAGRIHSDPLARRVMVALQQQEESLAQNICARIQQENEAYAQARDPVFMSQTLEHCQAHIKLMLALATLHAKQSFIDEFKFVRQHGVRRARQNFPLAPLLHAYRMGQQGIWHAIRDLTLKLAQSDAEALASTLLLSEYAMNHTDVISMIVAEAYVTEGRRLQTLNAQTLSEAVEDLLRGLLPQDGPGLELCEQNGIRNQVAMAIVIWRPEFSPDRSLTEHRGALQSIAELAERVIYWPGSGRLVHVRGDEVVVVVSGSRDVGTRVAKILRDSYDRLGIEHVECVRIGVGLEAREIAQLPESFAEAQRALNMTSPESPIVYLAEIPIIDYLLSQAEETALRLIPPWVERFVGEDRKTKGELARTVQAFGESNLNVKRTAKRLKLHANTVYFRLNRVREITNVDPRSFAGLTVILTNLRLIARQQRSSADPHKAGP